jgi:hypothetical protein
MMYWSKVVLAGAVFAAAAEAVATQGEYKGWGQDQEKEQVKRREDPATWDMQMLDADKPRPTDPSSAPFASGAFPVPKHDLVGRGSCRGNGFQLTETPWHDHYLLGSAFFVGRGPVNEKFIGDRKDEVFFHLLVLSVKKIQPDAGNARSEISSRNHPHVIGQGLFKMAKSGIDYVAFQTADRNAYAIVNMRLFDLRAGRVVIIAPQKDGTLRSIQLQTPALESKEVKDFDAKLLKEPRVVKFLDMPGNI